MHAALYYIINTAVVLFGILLAQAIAWPSQLQTCLLLVMGGSQCNPCSCTAGCVQAVAVFDYRTCVHLVANGGSRWLTPSSGVAITPM